MPAINFKGKVKFASMFKEAPCEIDPIYPIILLFNTLGIIHVPKQKSVPAVASTLHSQEAELVEEESW